MDGRVEGEEVKATPDRRLFEVGGEGKCYMFGTGYASKKVGDLRIIGKE